MLCIRLINTDIYPHRDSVTSSLLDQAQWSMGTGHHNRARRTSSATQTNVKAAQNACRWETS